MTTHTTLASCHADAFVVTDASRDVGTWTCLRTNTRYKMGMYLETDTDTRLNNYHCTGTLTDSRVTRGAGSWLVTRHGDRSWE